MRKYINRFTVNYFIQLVLNIVFIALLIWYYNISTVSVQLLTILPYDLAQYPVVFALLSLLIVFLICDIVFFIQTIHQTKHGVIEDWVKKARFVIPIVFIFFAQLCFFVPVGLTKVKNNLENQPTIVSDIYSYKTDFLDEAPYRDGYITCEKNAFGKAGYLESSLSYENGFAQSELEFFCSYQQCRANIIKDKFEKYYEEDVSLKNKIVGDGYTFYYETDKDGAIDYSLYIEKDSTVFFSTFTKYNINDFNYTKEQFIDDSLSVFNEWDKF